MKDLKPEQIRAFIHSGKITLAGNERLKIFGLLSCTTGKRMKASNRVFFEHAVEARKSGYRPCGHCLQSEYQRWKKSSQEVG